MGKGGVQAVDRRYIQSHVFAIKHGTAVSAYTNAYIRRRHMGTVGVLSFLGLLPRLNLSSESSHGQGCNFFVLALLCGRKKSAVNVRPLMRYAILSSVSCGRFL